MVNQNNKIIRYISNYFVGVDNPLTELQQNGQFAHAQQHGQFAHAQQLGQSAHAQQLGQLEHAQQHGNTNGELSVKFSRGHVELPTL